jgi:hypothetical protein
MTAAAVRGINPVHAQLNCMIGHFCDVCQIQSQAFCKHDRVGVVEPLELDLRVDAAGADQLTRQRNGIIGGHHGQHLGGVLLQPPQQHAEHPARDSGVIARVERLFHLVEQHHARREGLHLRQRVGERALRFTDVLLHGAADVEQVQRHAERVRKELRS